MRILLCTCRNPDFPTVAEYVEHALGELGHRVNFFDDRRYLLPGRLRRKVRLLESAELRRINRGLIRRVSGASVDACIVAGGYRMLPETVQALKRRGVTMALWTIDAPRDFDPVLRAAPHYDRVFCGGTEAIEILENHGVDASWLPFACDTELHRPVELSADDREAYGRDAVFVGSFYSHRLDVFKELAGSSFGIWGPGWQKVPADHPLRPHVVPGQTSPETWKKIYSAAKTVVVAHYQDGKTPCYQASPKVYEALACGAFVLADDQKDVFRLFEDGTHLVRFTNGNELKEAVDYYAHRPEERKRIAEAGRAEVLAKHTYAHRMRRLIKTLNERQ
ncbi:MAG: glycosyltransferase [Kiritimatiellia bacterium]